MNTRRLLAATVLAIAIGAPIAGVMRSVGMPGTTTSGISDLLFQRSHASQIGGKARLASFTHADAWLNSQPLDREALRGKVVLIDFWTYTCINWLRTAPYVRAWAEKYKDHGLVVVGVHAPEFAFEKDIDNVRRAVKDFGINHPVAVDNEHRIWRAFNNQYWPALYFIDAQGRLRHHHFGEGSYEQSEKIIQDLLAEAGATGIDRRLVSVDARGIEAAADWANLKSGENYLGYDRTDNFASPGGLIRNKPHAYAAPARLKLNEWSLTGEWSVRSEAIAVEKPSGRIAYRFHARDVHLVMGPSARTPVRFRLSIDGRPPAEAHGLDVDDQGYGIVTEQRMYQLIRQPHSIGDRTMEIEFFEPGVELFAFTFG